MVGIIVSAPKEKPIIFSSEMIRAILDGTKTMTRRVSGKGMKIINASPDEWHLATDFPQGMEYRGTFQYQWETRGKICTVNCPYGQVGDRLWVRESCIIVKGSTINRRTLEEALVLGKSKDMVFYKATDRIFKGEKLTPSIFMPRWASRITLEITEVRAERQLDITLEDAIAEGFGDEREFNETFLRLNPHLKGVNPWVFVISFKRLRVA